MTRMDFLEISKIKFERRYWAVVAIFAMGSFVISSILFGQSLFIYFIAIALCSIAIFLYPEAGLYTIVLLTMLFERHFALQELIIGNNAYKLYPIDIIILLIGFSLFFRFLQESWKPQFSKFDIPIGVFAGLCFFGFAQIFLRNADFALGFSTFKNYILYSIIYVFMVLLVKTKEDWKEFMLWFTVGGFGLFFFLFYGIFAGQGLWSEYTPLSTFGTRMIAGTHVFYMVLFGFWILALYLWRKQKTNFTKLLPILLFFINIGIIVSLVRHLWIALLIIFAVWLLFLNKKERQKIFSIVGGIGAILAVIFLLYVLIGNAVLGQMPKEASKILYTLSERVELGQVVRLTDSSFGWRASVWQSTISLWKTSPVIGVGFGQYIAGFHDVYPFIIPVRDAHNNYLGILLQMGVIGFTAVVLWFLWLIRTIYRLWLNFKNKFDFEAILFFTWGNIVLLFIIVFSISVYWDVNFFIIWWWIALSAIRWIYVNRSI